MLARNPLQSAVLKSLLLEQQPPRESDNGCRGNQCGCQLYHHHHQHHQCLSNKAITPTCAHVISHCLLISHPNTISVSRNRWPTREKIVWMWNWKCLFIGLMVRSKAHYWNWQKICGWFRLLQTTFLKFVMACFIFIDLNDQQTSGISLLVICSACGSEEIRILHSRQKQGNETHQSDDDSCESKPTELSHTESRFH